MTPRDGQATRATLDWTVAHCRPAVVVGVFQLTNTHTASELVCSSRWRTCHQIPCLLSSECACLLGCACVSSLKESFRQEARLEWRDPTSFVILLTYDCYTRLQRPKFCLCFLSTRCCCCCSRRRRRRRSRKAFPAACFLPFLPLLLSRSPAADSPAAATSPSLLPLLLPLSLPRSSC